ncbi:MAG: hypothetical protein E6J25_02370 [Chloroflexi bacterium]|nr:MAG: hypothetical protein E6J25_02370 [Chloroflexota bacterium]
MDQRARAPLAELPEGNQEEAPVELVVGRRKMHHGEISVGIFSDVRDWEVEIPIAIRAEMLKRFDLNRNREKRSKTPHVEVDTAIDDRACNRRGPAAGGFDTNGKQILCHGPELRGRELASPVRAVGRVEAAERIQQGHCHMQTGSRPFPSATEQLLSG